jgi:hypothetical protein
LVVGLDAVDETTREHFRSVSNLAKFVMASKAPEQGHTA